ncbi:hypothetical protein O6H91_13G030400 [Diphasiastrum complanatum]|uniref:Uncharacterized protein n=1 Tax=Diphasiastrum complanatum TaxID=34168 RepID=A0ACC2BTQ9_DIPCM|nr:hypothetical protein O6H91_13G030400 [Diphasiastrum complanatum]
MSVASVISSATCNHHLLTPSASVMVKMKGRGWRSQLLKGQDTSLLRVWKLERCCCGRDSSGIGKLRTRDAKGGVICSASNGFEEEEVGSIGDRLRWIQSREVPLARKIEGINPPKYPKLAENMSQEASKRDGLLNEAERLSHRRIDEEDLYIDPRSIGNGSKTRVEGDFSAEDPWLIKERNGSSSIQTNQAMDVAKAMPTTLNAERKPFDPVQFNAKEPHGSVNTQKSPNQPFSYLDDRTSNGQQAGRRIDTGYENYRAVRTIEDSYATDNSVGDDDSDGLGEDQGTVARESDGARGTSGLGRWDKSRTGSEDLSLDYSKRFLLFKRSNLIAKQVVSVSNATILGFVSQLWVDLQTLNVEALEIKPSLLSWQTDEIFLNNLSKIGDVILAKNDNVLDGDLTVPNCEALVGSDVLTENNVYLGKVSLNVAYLVFFFLEDFHCSYLVIVYKSWVLQKSFSYLKL